MSFNFPEIITERLRLRQIVESDQRQIFEGLSNPDVIRYYGISYPSFEEAKAQMEWFSYIEKTGTGIWWAVCPKGEDVLYGAGGINNIDKAQKKAELGFWLLPKHWSKGIMTEALTKIIDYAFSVLDLERVEGIVEQENLRCKKSISRFGFVNDKVLNYTEYKNGRAIDLEVYAYYRKS